MYTKEFMQELGRLCTEALATTEGMQALAAAVQPVIQNRIMVKNITSLLLTEHDLPIGETAHYEKARLVMAYWIALNSAVASSDITDEEVTFPLRRVATAPEIDISTLKHGNVGTLLQKLDESGDAIRKKIDAATIAMISAATPVGNTVSCAGGVLTAAALNNALGLVEDLETTVKFIVGRGLRLRELMNELQGTLDPITERELIEKGAMAKYNGAILINSSSCASDTILLVPEVEVGKCAYRDRLLNEPTKDIKRFKTGWVAWSEVAQGITFADPLAKIVVVD